MEWDNRIHKFRFLLRPLSCLYGMGVRFRNMLFDEGIWKEESFDVPVICVGNLAVGGTGKTPHIEYLIRLLKDKYRVAVVSRGYKRLTKGFVLAEMGHSYNDIGDEPFQIKHKFPKVAVAVDANRCEAIRLLMNLPKNKRPDVILLDDAFQHRYVQPSYSLLLTDYHRMYCKDSLLPAGCLREHRSGAQRADMVVVTRLSDCGRRFVFAGASIAFLYLYKIRGVAASIPRQSHFLFKRESLYGIGCFRNSLSCSFS